MAHKKAHEVNGYLDTLNPDSAPILILIYGGDSGGVYDIAQTIRRKWQAVDKESNLEYVPLTQEILSQSAAALCDAAASMGLFGDRRFIHIPSTIGGATLTDNVAYFLDDFDTKEDNDTDTIIIIEAGALTPASALRKKVEGHPRSMALPCYPLTPSDVTAYVRKWIEKEHYTIEVAASNILGERLAGDRGIMQRALERLVLYKGGSTDDSTIIQVQDVEALFGLSEQTNISALADAIGLGEAAKMDMMLAQLASLGQPPDKCLAPVRMHFQNLHLAVGLRAGGANINQAMGAIRPPVHFTRKAQMQKQISLWTPQKINRALTILHEAEYESRQGFPAGLTASAVARSFLRIASAARR